jgi:hypothetical protein
MISQKLIVALKGGTAKGFIGNVFIRNYGTSGAAMCYISGEDVIVTYKTGKTSIYRLRDGIRLRTL